MTRLTRAESQERTRGLLVDAAETLFLARGFGTTSLEQIGAHAGFTRGAVYSNFPSKTAMGNAVIDALYERAEDELAAALGAATDPDAWFDALAAWADRTVGDPGWTRLEIEIAAASAHEPDHRAATAARYARMRERWGTEIAARYGDAGAIDPETLATTIVAIALGTGAQRAVDPSVSGAGWVELLRAAAGPTSAVTGRGRRGVVPAGGQAA